MFKKSISILFVLLTLNVSLADHGQPAECRDFNYLELAKTAAELRMFKLSMPAALQGYVGLAKNPGRDYKYYEGSAQGIRNVFKKAHCDLSTNDELISVKFIKGDGLSKVTVLEVSDGYNKYRVESVTVPIKFGEQILTWAPVNLWVKIQE